MSELNDQSTQFSESINIKIDVTDILELLSKYDVGKSELISQIEALKIKIAEYEAQISELKQQIADFNNQESIEELISKLAGEPEPNDHKAYNYRGLICYYLDKGTREQAIRDFDKAIRLNPNEASYYYNRGLVYKISWYDKQAIDDFYKAIELNPNFAVKAYKNCGDIHLRRSSEYKIRYERAIQCYNKVIELNPNDTEAYFRRGQAYQGLQQYKKAIKDYDKALELNPNHTDAKNNRDACLKAMGK